MNRRTFLASAALVAAAVIAAPTIADDKKMLEGSWQLAGGEARIDFTKDEIKISPHNKDEVILIVCTYTVEKDGVVKAKVSELQGTAKDKAKDKIPAGLEFSFKWQAKDGAATLDDVKGENVDLFRSHLEGKYEKK